MLSSLVAWCEAFSITDPAVEGPRQTLDVDVIVDAPDLHGFSQTETELRARGFRNDMTVQMRPANPGFRCLPLELKRLQAW